MASAEVTVIRFRTRRSLLATCGMVALVVGSAPAFAQETPVEAAPPATLDSTATPTPAGDDTAIVVTGSRIRRDPSSESAPLDVLDAQVVEDRGYTSAGQAINELSSNTPDLQQAKGDGSSSGSGQQFPNLFGLGAGRTLTLLNGRRMVTSSSGLGDAEVDANIIPLGLLDRVEVVQGGGAAVYGSDAIAGVVNYVLKDHFQGIELDAQNGISTRGDYHTYSLRGTAGTDFAGGRGNIAVDVGYAKSPVLYFSDRPLTALSRVTTSNPADTGPADGIPAVQELLDARFWEFNQNGVVFRIPAPVPPLLPTYNGAPLQFTPDGGLAPYDLGTSVGVPFSSGGDGTKYSDLTGLRSGVSRFTATAVGHYELTPSIKVSGELLYARTVGTDYVGGESRTILNYGSYAGPIMFNRNNPYLTAQDISTLSAAYPAFGFGAPLFLSKMFYDLVPSNFDKTTTTTMRGELGVDGDFTLGSHDFYWSVSGSYARVKGRELDWAVDNAKFANAINAVNAGGQIVCGINADAITTNDDPSCAPINPFGDGNVSQAARDYVSVLVGDTYVNKQADFLATLGGDVVTLPGGTVKFSLAYEHRDERVSFTPLEASQLGLTGSGVLEVPQSGRYNTDELSGELLVPIVGPDMNVPFVRVLELHGAGRLVDNSIAGKEKVWDLGLRWQPVQAITLRASRSRNFRAPTLTQLFQPSTTALAPIAIDPCDADRIASGPNPEQRYASCLALFQANPGYGVVADGSNAGASAADRLAGFQDPSENVSRTAITTGGNPNLRNEISKTFTYGIVVQPPFIPGLTVSADRVEIDLTDGLSPFQTQDFAAACYDDPNPDPAVCGAFTRLSSPDGISPGGTIVTGTTTTFNAGVVKYRGEVYALDYRHDLGGLFGSASDLGAIHLNVAATHSTLLTTSVTGTTFTRTDDTYLKPTWQGRMTVDWTKGNVRLSYQAYYLGRTRYDANATIETTPVPVLKANLTHSVSAQFDGGPMTFRLGVDNLTDKQPSYPRASYGDILGRRFWVGSKIRM